MSLNERAYHLEFKQYGCTCWDIPEPLRFMHPSHLHKFTTSKHSKFIRNIITFQENVALDKKWIVDGELYAVYCSFDSFWYRARIRAIENDKVI